MTERCRICGTEPFYGRDETDICYDCEHTLRVVPLPPSRRLPRPCDRCGGTKLVRVLPRTWITPGDSTQLVALRMTLTATLKLEKRLLSSEHYLLKPSATALVGTLEAYVCRACGFVEWYCLDPEALPIGPEYMTEEIDVGSSDPYR